MMLRSRDGARNFFRPKLRSHNHIQSAPAPSKATPAPAHAKVAPVPSPTKVAPAPALTPVVESLTPAPTLVPSPVPALGKHEKKHKHKRHQAQAPAPAPIVKSPPELPTVANSEEMTLAPSPTLDLVIGGPEVWSLGMRVSTALAAAICWLLKVTTPPGLQPTPT